jgi:predicted Zn-dependent protease
MGRTVEPDRDDAPDLPLGADDETLGERLHDWLVAEYGHETEVWAVERVASVVERLNRVRAACPVPGACPRPLTCEILWVGAMNAFAAPGRYVYVTRELLQHGTEADPLAFVLGHEMAHHDLGHVGLMRGWARRLMGLPEGNARNVAARLLRSAERLAYTPDRERAADSYGLDLCLAAGFDGRRCLEAFDTLQAYALDHRAIDAVFGAEGRASEPAAGLLGRLRTLGAYPSITERRAALRAQLAGYGLS